MFRGIILGSLLGVACAAPGELQARACNRDNCFRDVFGTTLAGQSASGFAACSAFMTKVVTPCPSVTTQPVVTTVTAPAVTKAQTVTVTEASLSTSISTVLSTSINITTALSTASTTSFVTITSTRTVADASVATVTSVQGSNHIFPQDVGPFGEVKKRAANAAQCPVTSAATTVPAPYVPGCQNANRFSSVCLCNGIAAGVRTVAAATLTSVATTTVTITPTVSTTTTITTTVASLLRSTTTTTLQSVSTVTSLTTTTFISTSTATTVTTTMSTTTVVVPAYPTTFIIQASPNSGSYVKILHQTYCDERGCIQTMAIESVPSLSASLFTIMNNRLYTADGVRQAWSPPNGGVIELITPDDDAQKQFYQLMTVQLGGYDTTIQGSTLTFWNSPNSFSNNPAAPYFRQDNIGELSFQYNPNVSPYVAVPTLYAVAP